MTWKRRKLSLSEKVFIVKQFYKNHDDAAAAWKVFKVGCSSSSSSCRYTALKLNMMSIIFF